MKNLKVMLSSEDMTWGTPQDFFDKLNQEFHFTLDPCATKETAKCLKYYTKEDDGLSKSWDNEIVFCNPPYGREIGKWVEKASKAMGGGSSDVDTCSNRYKVFPRVYLQQNRNTFYQREVEVWRLKKLRSISQYGSDI